MHWLIDVLLCTLELELRLRPLFPCDSRLIDCKTRYPILLPFFNVVWPIHSRYNISRFFKNGIDGNLNIAPLDTHKVKQIFRSWHTNRSTYFSQTQTIVGGGIVDVHPCVPCPWPVNRTSHRRVAPGYRLQPLVMACWWSRVRVRPQQTRSVQVVA